MEHRKSTQLNTTDQVRRQPDLESGLLSADGPQTDGFVIQPFQTIAENISIWSVGAQRSVNSPFDCALEILLLSFTYLLNKPKQL